MMKEVFEKYPLHSMWRVEHDGFIGCVIGYYERIDGKHGVVMQQIGTNVVHVYGLQWLKPHVNGH